MSRYPGGYHGWVEVFPHRVEGERADPKILAEGDEFPECRLAILKNGGDRAYLGLAPETKWLSLADVQAEYILVQLYNSLCLGCVREADVMHEYFDTVIEDAELSGRLKFIGLGVHNLPREVVQFRKKHDVPFPLFSDRTGQIFDCLGQASLPLAYLLVREADGRRRIVLMRADFTDHSRPFFEEIRAAILKK